MVMSAFGILSETDGLVRVLAGLFHLGGLIATDAEQRLNQVEQEIQLIYNLARHVSTAAAIITFFVASLTIVGLIIAIWSFLRDRRQAVLLKQSMEDGARTVTLVNQILAITKSTMEQSSRARLQVAKKDREKVINKCVLLINKVPSGDYEYKSLASDPKLQEQLRLCGQEIISVDGELRSYREDQESYAESERKALKLTDVCEFLLGMHHHLEQNFTEAIKCWQRAEKLDEEFRSSLKPDQEEFITGRLPIWIAIENNNLGNFDDAILALNSAKVKSPETLRLLHETKFFAASNSTLAAEIEEAEAKLACYLASSNINVRVALLLGNMRLVHAMVSPAPMIAGDEGKTASPEHYFNMAPDDIWAQLGMAQWHDYSGDAGKCEAVAEEVLKKLRAGNQSRREPATRLLRKAAELLCAIWLSRIPQQSLEWGVREIESLLEELNNSLYVYSPLQKRYLKQADFRNEVRELYDSRDAKATFIKFARH
jgi:hypothetical protein